MCRLLVRTVSRSSPDPYKDARLTKNRDVIAALPDGWQFSERERTASFWMIVDIPGVSPDDPLVQQLLIDEIDVDITSTLPRRRGMNVLLDSELVPVDVRSKIGVTRPGGKRQYESVSLDETLFRQIVAEKPRGTPNPKVF